MRARVQAQRLLDELTPAGGVVERSEAATVALADRWTALAMVEAVERVADALERISRNGGRL